MGGPFGAGLPPGDKPGAQAWLPARIVGVLGGHTAQAPLLLPPLSLAFSSFEDQGSGSLMQAGWWVDVCVDGCRSYGWSRDAETGVLMEAQDRWGEGGEWAMAGGKERLG